jgi:hypothetical protein
MYVIYHDEGDSGKFENIQSIHGDDLSIQHFRGEVCKK